MAFCTNCGFKLAENANFCTNCGARVLKLVSPPPVVSSVRVSGPAPAPAKKGELKRINLRVHGTSFRQADIESLLINTEAYGARELKEMYDDYELIQLDIFKESPVTLEPEPTNEYDPNAVKVLIAGVMVGYIGKNNCAACKRRLEAGKIKRITAEVVGGNCAKIYPTDSGGRRIEYFYKKPIVNINYWYSE